MKLKSLLSAVGLAVWSLPLAVPALSQSQPAAAPPAAPAAAAPAAATAPPPIMPFDAALMRAATDLFSKAQLPAGDGKVALVIDPLIDGVSGVESVATRDMERRLIQLVKSSYPRFEVLPFNTQSVERLPIVLVGTFTAVNNAGQPTGPRNSYRICLALADLKSQKVVGKARAFADPTQVNHKPTPTYAETPVLGKDAAMDAYVKTCQASQLGGPVEPGYADKIVTAAVIADAVRAYDSGRYNQALSLYTKAKASPSGKQLRVHNGVYLSSMKLGRTDEAKKAFSELVEDGLQSGNLNVRFLFRPGSQSFITNRAVSKQYPMWIEQIAGVANARNACLEVVGHTSATGPAIVNERLSVVRAEAIRSRLASAQRPLAQRIVASGAGSSKLLVGTAKDDASDALDRRVEFKVLKC
jgi:outer membrane protein OmpA-like peptidoglycan-associated protein